MSAQVSLRLKPISISFYKQNDCPCQSAFTAKIQHGDTVYRSGVFRSKRKMILELIPLSWIQFTVTKRERHSYVHISLRHEEVLTESQLKQQNYSKYCKINNKVKEYTSLLPVNQLMQVPLNKKKRFSFPIMHQGQIKAEAQFKLLIKAMSKIADDLIFQNVVMKNENNENNQKRNKLQKETVKANQQNTILKPMMSDICIPITPQLFIRKQTVSLPQIPVDFDQKITHSEQQLYNEQIFESTTSNKSFTQLQQDVDLFTKFEKLNKKFEQENEKENLHHQHQSVWEQQQNGIESSGVWGNKRKAQSLQIYDFNIIKEENESSEGEN